MQRTWVLDQLEHQTVSHLGILEKPQLGPCNVELWPYQKDDIQRIRSAFGKEIEDERGKRKVRRVLYTLGTGLGKTTLAAAIIRQCIEKGGRVLFLAHIKELIEQPVNRFDEFGIESGIEMGELKARRLYEPDCVVASIQSMQKARLESWPSDYFRMLVIDECHHSPAKSYRNIIRHFNKAFLLGLTATPNRTDGEDLGQIFDDKIVGMNLYEGIAAKWLCELTFNLCEADIDLRDLRKKRNGDFSEAELEARIIPMIGPLANNIVQKVGDRPTLAFMPQIKSSQGMATALQSLGMKAEWSAGDDPARAEKIKKYRAGEIQCLCAANLFLEGHDLPETAALALYRATASHTILSQIVGRGTRLKRNYPDCLLLDVNFLTMNVDLVKPVDLFDAPNIDSDVLKYAKAILDKEQGGNMFDAIERAQRENEEKKKERIEQEVMRIKAIHQEVRWREVKYDPRNRYTAMGWTWREPRKDSVFIPATPKQIAKLKQLGWKDADSYSKSHAHTTLDYEFNRIRRFKDKGKTPASGPQIDLLLACGVDSKQARNMTYSEASAKLDSLGIKRKKKRP